MNLGPYEPNNIYCGECSEMMSHLPDGCIDLTVTSPPYDNLRTYHGFTFDYTAVISQLYRVTKPGGVVVWVVADATVKGSETGTSFRQALYAMGCGFRLHDTMIYQTDKQPLNDNRYEPKFEYMFVWSKGKPKTWNPIMIPSTYAGQKCAPREYNKNGTKKDWSGNGIVKAKKVLGNVWYFPSGKGKTTTDNINHSGMFPEALARDHIISWSNPGDLVFDPMIGSGTMAKMAMQNGRNYLGFDISEEYVELARRRVAYANPPLPLQGVTI